MTARLPVFTLLALTAIAGCESAHEAADVPEEALSPLTEIEIADPVAHSLEQLEDLYRRREAGLDDGAEVVGSSSWPPEHDGIYFLIHRLFWLTVQREDVTNLAEGAELVTEMIASHTGVAIEEVRQDVDGSIGDMLAEAREVRAKADADVAVVISLLDDGTVMLNGEEIAPAELTAALENVETPDGVTVKAERDVTAGTVDEVQKALVAAGIASVRFQTSR